MRRIFRTLLKRIKFLLIRFPKLLVALLKNRKLFDVGESYYPELPHKTKFRIFFDQLRQIIKWGAIEENYFLYGFDVKNFRNQDDYISFGYHLPMRNYLNNHPSKDGYSYTGVMRDKFYFSIFMSTLGFKVPETYGLLENGMIFKMDDKTKIPMDEILIGEKHLIFKPIDGWCGEGIFGVRVAGNQVYCDDEVISMEALKQKTAGEKFFIQYYIEEQHPDMRKLYPKAINTIRIATVRDVNTGKIELMGCMLLMGANEAIVSNWHYGGVIINIEDNGYLNKYGFSYSEKRIVKHPDTGVVFENFKVPFFEEAKTMAIRCHEMFYGIHSVGWDFAITLEGPVFIEANDNWGVVAHQMVGEGLANKFNKYFIKH